MSGAASGRTGRVGTDSWSSLLGPFFTAEVAEDGGVTVLRLAGDVDLDAAAYLGEVLSAACSATQGCLVVDVSGVAFLDAAGLGRLIAAHNHLLQQGRPGLAVWGAAPIVRRVFEITQTTSLLDDRELTFVIGDLPPEPSTQGRALDVTRRAAGVSVKDLFVDYFALGGTADLDELVAHLGGETGALDTHQQDVAIQALNERLVDLGRNDRVLAYASDGAGTR